MVANFGLEFALSLSARDDVIFLFIEPEDGMVKCDKKRKKWKNREKCTGNTCIKTIL